MLITDKQRLIIKWLNDENLWQILNLHPLPWEEWWAEILPLGWWEKFSPLEVQELDTYGTFETLSFLPPAAVAQRTLDRKIRVRFPAYPHRVWALWWQGGKRRLRTSRCPCRGRLGTLKTPSCPWRGCPAAGQNLETGHLSHHYIAKISLNVTLNHNQHQHQNIISPPGPHLIEDAHNTIKWRHNAFLNRNKVVIQIPCDKTTCTPTTLIS